MDAEYIHCTHHSKNNQVLLSSVACPFLLSGTYSAGRISYTSVAQSRSESSLITVFALDKLFRLSSSSSDKLPSSSSLELPPHPPHPLPPFPPRLASGATHMAWSHDH